MYNLLIQLILFMRKTPTMLPQNNSNSRLRFILIGGGGHGRVVLDTALKAGMNVYGILDPAIAVANEIMNIPVLGGDEMLPSFSPSEYQLLNGIGIVPGNNSRWNFFDLARKKGYYFPPLIHPSAILSQFATLTDGVQIMAGAIIQPNTELGVNAVVNTRSSIDHDCRIGDNVFIGPGAILCGGVVVGDSTFIGAGAVVLPGINIGEKSIIGAGVVVRHDVIAELKVTS